MGYRADSLINVILQIALDASCTNISQHAAARFPLPADLALWVARVACTLLPQQPTPLSAVQP